MGGQSIWNMETQGNQVDQVDMSFNRTCVSSLDE
jgi:hypothetical protein